MRVTRCDLDRVLWAAAPADRLRGTECRLRRREARGLAPPFVPYAPRERTDPSALMSGARSVIVFAVPYWHPKPPDFPMAEERGPRAVVSRSSWGQDYHRVVPGVVRQLLPRIVGRDAADRAYVQADAGPLEEKAWALRAGLGRLGHNTCIHVPPYGSWVFLAVAIVDVQVDAAEGATAAPVDDDACSGCGRCLAACPTGALMEPHRINPLRCLSWVTQRRGFLPRAFRRSMGDRLFGCDTCQLACPINREIRPGLTAFAPEDMDVGIDPFALLSIDENEFQSTWGGKSSGWRGSRTLQRNALIVCGNRGGLRELDRLLPHLEDSRPVIRGHSLWAVEEILRRSGAAPPVGLRRRIEEMLRREDSRRVRFAGRRLLDALQ